MKFDYLKKTAGTLDEALEKIKQNTGFSFLWYPVKNKKGFYFEVGGTNRDGKLVYKAYIGKIRDGRYIVYPNGFLDSEYSLDNKGYIEFPNFRDTHKIKDLKKFLDNTDFKTYRPRVIEKEVVEYSTFRTVKM